MERYTGILGILVLLGIAYLLSNNRKAIKPRIILWGISLQLLFGIFILKTKLGNNIFSWFDKVIKKLLDFSLEGSQFLFGNLARQEYFIRPKEAPTNPNDFPFWETWPGFGFQFAFYVLPTVIFFSALMSVLYHVGIMQKFIRIISYIMQKTMKTSGPETTSISANIFVGQTEAPLVIKPFISKMTNSELTAIMVGGFATVAGGVMAAYVGMLSNIPGIAGHLLAASIMSAPAALVVAKIIYPEDIDNESNIDIENDIFKKDQKNKTNLLEAISNGTTDGLKLAANIAAMLLAFISLIALANYILDIIIGIKIETILGYIFMPLAWTMGAPLEEAQTLGSLLGQKLVLSELIAYLNLSNMEIGGTNGISEKTAVIASYALCGFANFASIGIQLGGIGALAPDRKKDLSKLVIKALIGGAIASWLTACIAGILIT